MSKLYAIIGTDSNNEIVAFAGYDRDLGEDRVVIFDANQYTEMPTEWSRKYSRYALRKKCNRITYKPSHIVEAFTNPNSKNQFVWFYVRQFATELNNRRFKGITTWRPVRLNSRIVLYVLTCDLETGFAITGKYTDYLRVRSDRNVKLQYTGQKQEKET